MSWFSIYTLFYSHGFGRHFQLRLDVEELKRLIELSTRQSVKDALGIETRRLETEISLQLKDNTFNLEAKPAKAAPVAPR